jgi:hypothetical protein
VPQQQPGRHQRLDPRLRQYITSLRGLGTLMRHDLRQRWWWWWWVEPLALPIAAGSPCMGKATRAATLIPPAGLAHGCPARLRAAFAPAVTTPTVARAAHHHLGLAACANKYSGADALASEPAQRACSSHRRSGCVFRTIVTDRFGIVTADFGNVTGHFGDVTDGVLSLALSGFPTCQGVGAGVAYEPPLGHSLTAFWPESRCRSNEWTYA